MKSKEVLSQLLAKLAPRERNLAALAIGVITLLIMDNLLITPYQNKIADLNRELQFRHKQKAIYQRTIANAKNIEDQFKKYEPFFKATTSSTEDSQAAVLANIENRARKNGVQLVDVSPHDTKDYGLYLLFEIEIEVIGSPEKIIGFLYELTRGTELIATENIELRPMKKTSEWRASITVSKAFKKAKKLLIDTPIVK